MNAGINLHPDWYPGLHPSSSQYAFQMMLHKHYPDQCPKPCTTAFLEEQIRKREEAEAKHLSDKVKGHKWGLHELRAKINGANVWRRFLLYVPGKYRPGQRIPLWVMAPGTGDKPEVLLRMSGLQGVAENQTFALAVLQGSKVPGQGNVLNVGLHGLARKDLPDDVAYTRSVLREVSSHIFVDFERTRCVGFSRGGRFCSRLASELSTFISGIAPVSGIRFPQPNNATRPMPIMAFHGTWDPVNPFGGNGNPSYWHEPVPSAVRQWAHFNGCGHFKSERWGPKVAAHRHFGCKENADVVLVQIEGAGHTWPGSWYGYGMGFGVTTHEIEAGPVMCKFFAAHPRKPKCHTALPGEPCYRHVMWAKNRMIFQQPRLYDGLTHRSTFESWQKLMRKKFYADCPFPCPRKATPSTTHRPTVRPVAKRLKAQPCSLQDKSSCSEANGLVRLDGDNSERDSSTHQVRGHQGSAGPAANAQLLRVLGLTTVAGACIILIAACAYMLPLVGCREVRAGGDGVRIVVDREDLEGEPSQLSRLSQEMRTLKVMLTDHVADAARADVKPTPRALPLSSGRHCKDEEGMLVE